jgi:hypothetical protein
MASLRQAILASSAGIFLLGASLTYLSGEFSSQATSDLGLQEKALAYAAAQYLRSNAVLNGTTLTYPVNGQTESLKNGSYALFPVSAFTAGNYVPPSDVSLVNGQTPSIVVRNENGGASILVVPGNVASPYSLSLGKIGNFMQLSPWVGGIGQGVDANDQSATLVAMGGAFLGNASDYGVTLPSHGFTPVGWMWIPSLDFTGAAKTNTDSPIAQLKAGQTYTDAQGNTFTAYSSNQGVVIETSGGGSGYNLWFPQEVFSENPPSIQNFYVPSGTGTGDAGEGPYSLSTSGQTVEGFWYGHHLANFPLSDF